MKACTQEFQESIKHSRHPLPVHEPHKGSYPIRYKLYRIRYDFQAEQEPGLPPQTSPNLRKLLYVSNLRSLCEVDGRYSLFAALLLLFV